GNGYERAWLARPADAKPSPIVINTVYVCRSAPECKPKLPGSTPASHANRQANVPDGRCATGYGCSCRRVGTWIDYRVWAWWWWWQRLWWINDQCAVWYGHGDAQ